MIKAIIFDCFGVLYTDGKSKLIDSCPVENRQALGDLFMQTDYGFISGDEFTTKASALLGIEPAELKAVQGQLYFRNEQLVERMQQYKDKYKIGLLSNVSEDFFNELFTPADKAELFDAVVLSSNVGLIKPSAEIYSMTVAQLGVQPDEAVMIDDVERNVQGARDVGMQGIHFTSTTQTIEELEALLQKDTSRA